MMFSCDFVTFSVQQLGLGFVSQQVNILGLLLSESIRNDQKLSLSCMLL